MTKKRFAVFDIDGTLIRWQLYHAVVNAMAKEGLLGKNAYEDIRQSRMIWKKRLSPDAFKDYELEVVRIHDEGVKNISFADFQKVTQSVFEEYKDQTYVFTRDLIKSLKRRGYFLLAISGSYHEIVELFSRYWGFDDWVGSRYERKDGRFTGKKFVASHNKSAVLEEMIAKHSLSVDESVGVGDSGGDVSMLEAVDMPIAFNPDRKLFEYAQGKGWKIVIERKNMVYELEERDGRYQLVKTNAG